jgi:hypothetical protein
VTLIAMIVQWRVSWLVRRRYYSSNLDLGMIDVLSEGISSRSGHSYLQAFSQTNLAMVSYHYYLVKRQLSILVQLERGLFNLSDFTAVSFGTLIAPNDVNKEP